jgi:LysR family glycine cleavage system transcriptional activator
VNSAIERLRETFASLSESHAGTTLTVSAAPSFAAKWLLPRLSRFLAGYPEIEVSLKATVELVDFERNEADLGIRYGRGQYGDLVTELLMREMVFPVCSPELIAGQERRPTGELLNASSLLHDDSADQNEALPGWKMWLRAAAIEGVDWHKGPHFNQTALAIEAAAAGLGVALAPAALVEADIARGRLVRLASAEFNEPFAYYLVYPEARRDRPAVKALRGWLFEELNANALHGRILQSSAA